jgi:hypothetical protein
LHQQGLLYFYQDGWGKGGMKNEIHKGTIAILTPEISLYRVAILLYHHVTPTGLVPLVVQTFSINMSPLRGWLGRGFNRFL